MSLDTDLAARLAEVRGRIACAAASAGRDPSAVRLVAVSKTYPASHVRAAFAAGQRDFGENRVQEALGKIEETADLPLCWHLVGHLQSNKARRAASAFPVIHSVDSVGLLQALDRAAEDAGAAPQVLVQVDLAGEATKHGAPPEALGPLLEAAAACRAARLGGLMLMPPYFDDPEDARPFFRRLRELRDELREAGGLPDPAVELSMGMSHDLEVAVAEGATIVRVGTAIFGPRAPNV
ncbi:MAG: pyridoxal phosphate enzyme, YggS family [Acidobacteria bacterium]|nr:pyridoxal phosphate enzyme, YggS family [Acidobacteriota bacterium]